MRTVTKVWGSIALFCLIAALISVGAVKTLALGFFVVCLGFTLVHVGIDLVEWWQDRQLDKAIWESFEMRDE
jgi:hypothetical protein